jgi:epoxyqueuosine reductase
MPKYMKTAEVQIPYSIVSVERFGEFREKIEMIKQNPRFGRNALFRSYIKDSDFQLPPDFPTARSVILVASPKKIARTVFNHKGRKYPITIPAQYYANGLGWKSCMELVQNELIPDASYRVQIGNDYLFLKNLSVMTGLGEYGRNNICYVEGMGSFGAIYAYFTDAVLEYSPIRELKLMDSCEHCAICIQTCPHGCISEENIMIDIDHCVTLYNEMEGEFPEWIKPEVHNALMGCVRCQLQCPANAEVVKDVRFLEEITEEETEAILNESTTTEQIETIARKLSGYAAANDGSRKVFSRNLRVLLEKAV